MKEEKLFAWYSAKMFERNRRYNIYLTKDGKEVAVTHVSNDKDSSYLQKVPDAVFMGEVIKHIQRKYSDWFSMYLDYDHPVSIITKRVK
nr:hypothetical protein [uncultured Mediterranean phage uvMED]